MTLHLIACAAQKLDRPAPARELYTSDLFRKAVSYAEGQGAPWVVLSALYGVVLPDAVIEPYDMTLNTMSAKQRMFWGEMAADQLWPFDGPFVFLAGVNYRQPMVEAHIWRARGYSSTIPMEGLGIGEQKAWLLRETRRIAA